MEVADKSVKRVLATRPATRPVMLPRASFSYKRRRLYNALILAGGDLLALGLSVLLAHIALHGVTQAAVFQPWHGFLLTSWFCGAFLLRMLPDWGLGPVEGLRRIVLLSFVAYGSTDVAVLLYRGIEPLIHTQLILALLFGLCAVPTVRGLLKRTLIRYNRWGVPTVIYGGSWTGGQILRLLKQEQVLGYQPIGVFVDDAPAGAAVEGIPVLGSTEHVHPGAPVAVLIMPSMGQARTTELLEGPLAQYRSVIVIPDLLEIPSLWVNPRDLQGMLGLEIRGNPHQLPTRFVKRVFDVTMVLLTAPLWLPLCTAMAALIWLEDRGNPFFLQERIGAGGRRFHTWKFRTMFPNAEEILQRCLESDEALRDEWVTTYKLKQDPRITRIGHLLRRYSLDELPQLFNVLRGDMSLVGPRPLPLYHHEALPPRVQELRIRVRPGISGLWQVSGRSDAGMEGMILWDPYYVRNWSLWLDAVILIRTVHTVIRGSGAY